MGEPKGKLVTPVAYNPDDELRSLEVDANDYLKVAEQGTPTVIAKPHADEKLFGFESVINKTYTADATAGALFIPSDCPDPGKIWKITHVTAWNEDGDIATKVSCRVYSNSVKVIFHTKVGSTAQKETVDKHVELYLDDTAYIRIFFDGIASGETCYLNIFGYEMNAP